MYWYKVTSIKYSTFSIILSVYLYSMGWAYTAQENQKFVLFITEKNAMNSNMFAY